MILQLALALGSEFLTTGHIKSDTLRGQFRDFIISGDIIGKFTFKNIKHPVENGLYEIKVELNELIGEDIYIWGGGFEDTKSKAISQGRLQDIKNKVRAISINLESIIRQTSSKKVRIFPLHFAPSEGYKFGLHRTFLPEYVATDHQSGSFVVDFSDAASTTTVQNSRTVLEFIGYIMNTYPDLFILKNFDATWDNGEMICAVGLKGFVNKDEIYSTHGHGSIFEVNTLSKVFEDPVNPGTFISFYDRIYSKPSYPNGLADIKNEEWKTLFSKPFTLTTTHFAAYIDNIRTGTLPSSSYLNTILNL